jgi:hypothetical protein
VIPRANATLTAITAVGTSDDYDDSGTAGSQRWAGSVGAYVVDELIQDTTPGTVTERRRTSLVVPSTVARQIKRGDTITFNYQGVQQARRARDLRITEIVGTARIALEDA